MTVVVDTKSEQEARENRNPDLKYEPTDDQNDYHIWQWSDDGKVEQKVDFGPLNGSLRTAEVAPLNGDTRVNMIVFIGKLKTDGKPEVKAGARGVELKTADLKKVFPNRTVTVSFWQHMAQKDKESNKPVVKDDKELYKATYTHERVAVGGNVSIPAPTDAHKHLGETSTPFPKNTKFEFGEGSFSNGLILDSAGAITGTLDASYSTGKKALYVKVRFPDGTEQIVDAAYELMTPVTVTLDTTGYPSAKEKGQFHVWQSATTATGGATPKDVIMTEGPEGTWTAKLVPIADEKELRFFVYQGTVTGGRPDFAKSGSGAEIRTATDIKAQPGETKSLKYGELDKVAKFEAPKKHFVVNLDTAADPDICLAQGKYYVRVLDGSSNAGDHEFVKVDEGKYKAEFDIPGNLSEPTFVYFKGAVKDGRIEAARSLSPSHSELRSGLYVMKASAGAANIAFNGTIDSSLVRDSDGQFSQITPLTKKFWANKCAVKGKLDIELPKVEKYDTIDHKKDKDEALGIFADAPEAKVSVVDARVPVRTTEPFVKVIKAENDATLDVEGTLPAGVKFDKAKKTIEGTPEATAEGEFPLVVKATNAAGKPATFKFVLKVLDGVYPSLTVKDQTATVGVSFEYTPVVTDNNEGWHLNLDSGPAWLKAEAGRLYGTPGADDVKTHTVKVSVTDAAGNTFPKKLGESVSFTIKVVAKQTAPVPPETDKPGTDPKEPGKKPEAPETTPSEPAPKPDPSNPGDKPAPKPEPNPGEKPAPKPEAPETTPKPEPKPVPTPGKTSGTVDNTVTPKYDQVNGVKVVGTNDPIFPEASDPASCTVKPFVMIVPMKGVSYSVTVDGEEIASVEGNGSKFEYPYGKTVVVTAKAIEGYQLAKDAKTEWSWTAPTLEELKCTIPAHKLVPGQTIPGNSVPGVIVPDVEGQQINDTLKIIIDRALKDLSAGASEKGSTVVAEKAAPAKADKAAEKAAAKAHKPLAHTGATVAGLSIAAVVLLLAGGAVALIRRRQG